MSADRDGGETATGAMEPRRFARARVGAAISIIGHAVLIMSLVFAGVQLFDPSTREAISVDLVSPDEVAPRIPPPPASEPAAQPVPSPQPQPQSQLQHQQQAAAQPRAAIPPRAPPPAAQPPAQPYPTAEPDITAKYGVMFGLPDVGRGEFDAVASSSAKVAAADVEAFRSHLKRCAALPGSIARGDRVRIKLRTAFTIDGWLARPPALIEASASAKGPALMQAAINALQACQPYAMLPADKYDEWKVLDLGFTPEDFGER